MSFWHKCFLAKLLSNYLRERIILNLVKDMAGKKQKKDKKVDYNNNGHNKAEDQEQEQKNAQPEEGENKAQTEKTYAENSEADINSEDIKENSDDDVQARITQLENEVKEARDKHIRLSAEFENFRKRTQREKQEMASTANEKLIRELLPVVDDMERAKKAIDEGQDFESVKEGVELVIDKFFKILNQQGLQAFESIGTDFDSEYHEAISTVPAPSEDQKGKVVDEVEKGYYLNDKLVRFAKVVIGD